MAGKNLSLSVSLRANISDLEAKLKQAKKSVKEIGDAMKQAFSDGSSSAVELAGAYDKANAEAERLSAELKNQKTLAASFNELKIRPFKDIDADIAKAEKAYQTLKNSGELSIQALSQAKLKLQDRINELKSQTNGWTESLYNAKAGLAAVAAGFAAIGGAIKQAMDMEALNAKLKYATGSAEEAGKALKFTSDMANRLGIDALSAAQGFSGIAAAARGSALEGKNARDVFEAIATASRVVGLTSDQMGGALLAVQQMMSKGVVSAEEFRGQLGERLPGATRIAADALGVTEAQFAKMLDTGQIVASDFLPKFSSAMMAAFGPESQSAGASTAAQFARLVNHSRDLAISLGSILLPAVNSIAAALSGAAKWVSEFSQAHPALTALAVVGGTLAASWSTLTGVVLALRVGMTGMMANIMALPAAFAASTTAAKAFNIALGPLIVAFTAGFEFGTWLRGFELVRIAGVFMISTLMQSFEQLRYAWEAFAAIFTGDTIEQANLRHIQRLQEIQAITAQMYADASIQSSASAESREQDEAAVAAAAVASAEQQKAAYAGLNAIIEQQFAARMAEIQTYYATLQAEVEVSTQSQAAKQAAETQLFIADYTERLAAMKDFYAQSEALINLDAQTKKAGMKAGSDAEKAVDAEILAEKQKLYANAQQAFAAHVDALNKEYYRHLAAVRDIEQQKLDFLQGAEDALRDIRMQGMSEYEKYNANMRQIDELTSQAKQALVDGDLKKAQQYSNEAIALAKANSNAVTDGDRQAVTSSQARYTAQEKIKKIMAEMTEGMDAAKEKEKQKAEQVKQAWDDSQKSLDTAKTALTEISEKLSQSYSLTISSNASDVQAQINQLTQPTSSTHTIYVTEVKTGGGDSPSPVGANNGGPIGFNRGGPVISMVQRFATGGPVFKRPGWLKVPGSGNGDTEPAALDAGSYVVKKSASQYYGDGLMGAIASGVQKFAFGGGVAPIFTTTANVATGGKSADKQHTMADFIAAAIPYINQWNQTHGQTSLRWEDFFGKGKFSVKNVIANAGNPEYEPYLKDIFERAKAAVVNTNKNMTRYGEKPIRYFHGVDLAAGGGSAKFTRYPDADGYAAGGDVVGTDTVPAMLTPGEWVVKKSAVSKYGIGFLDALNNMRIPRAALAGIGAPPVARFATGGLVPGAPIAPSQPSPSDSTVTIRFAAPGGQSVSGQFGRGDVNTMLNILKAAGARAS